MVLEGRDISVKYTDGFCLHNVDISVDDGEIVSVVGESGSGKTTLAKALTGLQDENAKVSGQVFINGRDIYSLSDSQLNTMRQVEFAIAFQNSHELLNPLLTIGEQFNQVLCKVYKTKEERSKRARELLDVVGLDEEILKMYPKELSGGMVQRFLLISAVALNPKLVILDEPTSSLDVGSKHKIVHLILEINKRFNIAFVVITHDFWLAKHISTKMMIFYRGHLVEQGVTTDILENPVHPYTRGLINSSMDINLYKDIWGIRTVWEEEEYTACPFYSRCTQCIDSCKENVPHIENHKQIKNRMISCNRGGIITMIEGNGLEKCFGKKRVLSSIDLRVQSGEIVSVVGISGVGKTTLSRIIGGYDESYEGCICFEGQPVDFKALHSKKGGIQMVFQDPYTSINQKMTVEQAVGEPLMLGYPDDPLTDEVKKALFETGLSVDKDFLARKMATLSGGQQQRVSIARALIMKPKVLIADEPTSMLDPSSKANMIRRLKRIQNRKGLSMLIITHDISCAMKISDKIYMLKDGCLHCIHDIKELEAEFAARSALD